MERNLISTCQSATAPAVPDKTTCPNEEAACR